jgi:energy-converting hydrogenase B subunit D
VILIGVTLGIVLVVGTGVVLTQAPERQAVTLSVFGLAMALLFMTLQAPDVALSEVAVETAVVPLVIMLTVRKLERRE